uniref:Uncharacterized protein n=1 Tax=Pterocladia lucida TaxID=31408 RepID=A0A6M3WWR7_PTELU|nr:hypothetical protein [Pterocladia lucida]
MLVIFNNNMHLDCNKLAFNINMSLNFSSKKKIFFINKVYLEDYPLSFSKIKGIDKLIICRQKLYSYIYYSTYQNLYRLFYCLKLYGYFNNLKAFNISKNSNRYLFLDMEANPIIKSIKIEKYKTLLIPENVIFNLLKKQLGLPKNYNQINNSINSIQTWYKFNGFIWTDTKIVKQRVLSSISIKINEGIVKKVKIICLSHCTTNRKLIYSTDLLIKQELKISPGHPLNIYSLEKGIEKIKHNNTVSSFYYRVHKSTNGLYIVIKYHLPSSKEIQYSGDKLISNYYLFLSQYSYLSFLYVRCNIRYFDSFYNIYSPRLFSFPKILNHRKYFRDRNLYFKNLRIKNKKKMHIINYKKNNKIYNRIINKLKLTSTYHILHKLLVYIETKNLLNIDIETLEKLNFIYGIFSKMEFNFIRTNLSKVSRIYNQNSIWKTYLIHLSFRYKIAKAYIFKFFQGYYSLIMYTNLYTSVTNYYYNFYCLNQHLRIKYKHTISIPKISPYIKKSFFSLILNTSFFIGENKQSDIVYFNQQKKINLTLISIFNFEYNISIVKYTWLYLFINILKYNNLSSLTHNNHNLYYLNSHLGLGIQLDSFIERIPPIRLEYILNNTLHKVVHFYVHYIYNE